MEPCATHLSAPRRAAAIAVVVVGAAPNPGDTATGIARRMNPRPSHRFPEKMTIRGKAREWAAAPRAEVTLAGRTPLSFIDAAQGLLRSRPVGEVQSAATHRDGSGQ